MGKGDHLWEAQVRESEGQSAGLRPEKVLSTSAAGPAVGGYLIPRCCPDVLSLGWGTGDTGTVGTG